MLNNENNISDFILAIRKRQEVSKSNLLHEKEKESNQQHLLLMYEKSLLSFKGYSRLMHNDRITIKSDQFSNVLQSLFTEKKPK